MGYLSKYTTTENGALTHRNTGSAVLDFFSRAGAMRDRPDEVVQLFRRAFAEDETLALRALFWLRDIRGGAGERELFRRILIDLSSLPSAHFSIAIQHVAEFGRWDDLVEILDCVHSNHRQREILELLRLEIAQFYATGKPTLLAKWLPSDNAGTRSRMLASIIKQHLKMNTGYQGRYRRMLTQMRDALYIVERDMSADRWNKIPYQKVPSRANFVYKDAFLRHDEDRFIANLGSIKSGTVAPYELFKRRSKMDERVLDAMWKNLPNYMNGRNVLVLADVSGSMSGDPMAVSVSLALYASQRTSGLFKNCFMTFESTPRIVTVEPGTTKQQMNAIEHAPWGGSTNLQAAFDLMLGIAQRDRVPASEMPEILFIISDMEFNVADRSYTQTNHDAIVAKYREAGYAKPLIVYWNVNSRQQQAPIRRDEFGAVLISGLSATIFANVLSLDFDNIVDGDGGEDHTTTITPMEAMLQILNGERYSKIV